MLPKQKEEGIKLHGQPVLRQSGPLHCKNLEILYRDRIKKCALCGPCRPDTKRILQHGDKKLFPLCSFAGYILFSQTDISVSPLFAKQK